jgi:hypothetical protein
MSDQKSEPWGLNQMMAVAAVRHCVTVYGATIHVCALWVIANWGEFTPETQDAIKYEVERAMDCSELQGAYRGSVADDKWRDLAMIRTLWMRKGAE